MKLILLLIAGYVFYGLIDLKALGILVAMSFITYCGGKIAYSYKKKGDDSAAKYTSAAFIIFEIAVLCFFKYSGLIPMPVGMSFYMLMAIGFIADCANAKFDNMPSVTQTLVYISFFPTVISGPILKAKDFIPQLSKKHTFTKERLYSFMTMFAVGAFFKLVMADRLSVAVDKVYATPLVFSGMTLFFTSVTYTLQLYFDFAGYSYMAIAAATLLGFDIAPNFNLPYLATNPSEFWRRWHISLSEWLRDYVYIPLGGSRKGFLRTYINIFLVMVVSGLWHGSTINFLIWGMLHGIGQIIHRAVAKPRKKDATGSRIFSMIINFLFINFLWIPFRVPTPSEAWMIFKRIITFAPGASYYYVYTFIFGVLMLITQFIGSRFNNGNDPIKPLALDKLYAKVIFCMIIIVTAMFAYFGNGAFIYSQF